MIGPAHKAGVAGQSRSDDYTVLACCVVELDGIVERSCGFSLCGAQRDAGGNALLWWDRVVVSGTSAVAALPPRRRRLLWAQADRGHRYGRSELWRCRHPVPHQD